MKKNLFLTFCFSFIPGAGQMYQEYMKRGISIMLIFGVCTALSAIVGTPLFAIPLPIIYAYSFFDTYNIRNKIERNIKEEDEYIWNNKGISLFKDINLSKRNTILGIILLLVGIYLLFNNVVGDLAMHYNIDWLNVLVTRILRYLPAIIISAISIAIGVKLLFNKK
jgi:hypothetical protein